MDFGTALGQGLQNFAQAYMASRQRQEDEALKQAALALDQYKQLATERHWGELLTQQQAQAAAKERQRQEDLQAWVNAINALEQGNIAEALRNLGPYVKNLDKLIALRYGPQGVGPQTPFDFPLQAPLVRSFREGSIINVTPSATGKTPPDLKPGNTKIEKTYKPEVRIDQFGNIIEVRPDGTVRELRPGPGVPRGTPGGGIALINPKSDKPVKQLVPGEVRQQPTELQLWRSFFNAALHGLITPPTPDQLREIGEWSAKLAKDAVKQYGFTSYPGGIETYSTTGGGRIGRNDNEEEEDW